MSGKVFISCGQALDEEKRVAAELKTMLVEFGLDPYLAFQIQSLSDIMVITKELRSSDYLVFIDFLREPRSSTESPVSIFTHQELAVAHMLGFGDNMIALKHKDLPLQGFLRYVLSNPAEFSDYDEVVPLVRKLVTDRMWSQGYSRNLVVEQLGFSDVFKYRDHTGASIEHVWKVRVNNCRRDIAAVGSVCIPDYYMSLPDGRSHEFSDRSYLKWAGQAGYTRTILPRDFGDIDLLATRRDAPGVYLHSLRDTPREPVIVDNGEYLLSFKLYSEGFPLKEFIVRLHLNWEKATPPTWNDKTTAKLETT